MLKKVIRDTFTMPEADYSLISKTMNRRVAVDLHIKKSEVVRAGLLLLNDLNDKELGLVLNRLVRVKTGAPSRKKRTKKT